MNFAGDDTWKVRIHPRIDSINQSEGCVTGGQVLTIAGVSLNSTDSDITVVIDGVDCPVDYDLSTSTSITCTTGAASAGSYTGNQPGSLGIQVKQVDPSSGTPTFTQLTDGTYDDYTQTVLYTSWEDERNRLEDHGTWFNGYFRAPATTNYRFYLSSDDASGIYLDQNAFDPDSSDD